MAHKFQKYSSSWVAFFINIFGEFNSPILRQISKNCEKNSPHKILKISLLGNFLYLVIPEICKEPISGCSVLFRHYENPGMSHKYLKTLIIETMPVFNQKIGVAVKKVLFLLNCTLLPTKDIQVKITSVGNNVQSSKKTLFPRPR